MQKFSDEIESSYCDDEHPGYNEETLQTSFKQLQFWAGIDRKSQIV